MTVTRLIMPKLGMTMENGIIIKWLRREGDSVKKGEEILEIETDKVTIKVESPASGVLRKILAQEKAVIPVGQTIAIISDPGDEIDIEVILKEEAPILPSPMAPVQETPSGIEKSADRIMASPRAKMIAREKSVNLKYVKGTGPGGRIIERDVINYLEHPVNMTKSGIQVKESRPLEGIRKVIAERMWSSLLTAAQLTITMETDVTFLEKYRDSILPYIEKQEGVKISFTEIVIKIVSRALEEFPFINSIIEDDQIKQLDEINIGIAVATEAGLIVPVIHNVNKKSLIEISRTAKDLVKKARTSKLSFDEISRGTFTVSNLGMFGVETFTPILNPPEIGILGLGKIANKLTVEDGPPKITPMMQLSFTFDHRVIDGHIAAQFLSRIKDIIQNYDILEQLYPMVEKAEIPFEDRPDADLIIIGGGPGGYTAAVRAVQLGLSVILVEKSKIGGMCVNHGCIPSKTLTETIKLFATLRNAKERGFGLQASDLRVDYEKVIERKDNIVKMVSEGIQRNLTNMGVQLIRDHAVIKGPRLIEIQTNPPRELKCNNIIIATGSQFKNPEFNPQFCISNNQLLNMKRLPKSMVLLGINTVSLEYAMLFNELGVEVKILDENLRNLKNFDRDVIESLFEILDMRDIEILQGVKILDVKIQENQKFVSVSVGNKTETIQTEVIVNLLERVPNTDNLFSGTIEIETKNGRIITDEYLETSISGIFAIGDVQNQIMLSHVAMYEGNIAAENLVGKRLRVNYSAVPKTIYTFPEIAGVGMTEEKAIGMGHIIKTGKRSFGINAMARILGEPDGFIKIMVDKDTNEIYGIQVIGPGAAELVAECALSIGKNLKELALKFNHHPSLSEIINEYAWELYVSTS